MRSAKRSRLHAWPRSEQKHKEIKVKEQWEEMNKRITDLMKELTSDGLDRTVAVLDELQCALEHCGILAEVMRQRDECVPMPDEVRRQIDQLRGGR